MTIITEEMRFRKRLCEFALKNGLEKVFIRKRPLIDNFLILCYNTAL